MSKGLLVVGVLVVSVAPVRSAPLDAAGVFRGAMGCLDSHQFREVHAVYPASDGTVWVVVVDWNWRRGGEWFARRLSAAGEQLGGDVRLSPDNPRLPGNVVPIGVLPDGSLVLDMEDGLVFFYLAKISPDGSYEMTQVPSHFLGRPFVDGEGTVHFLSEGFQVDMTAESLPSRRPRNGRQADSLAPEELYFRPNGTMALHSERRGQLLAAREVPGDSSLIGLFRVSSRTMAIVDSGAIHRHRDVCRIWSGAEVPWPAIVPASDSGYWLFVPTRDTPPAPTVVAYRFRPSLKPVPPAVVEPDVPQAFDAAPKDGVVSVERRRIRPTPKERGGIQVKLRLRFTAFGSNGRLYQQTHEDSLASLPKK